MKTPTHPIPERYAALMERMRPAPGAGLIAVALWHVFRALMGLLAGFDERCAREQACQEDAGAEPAASMRVPGMVVVIAEGRQVGQAPGAGSRSASRLPRRTARPRATARPRTIAAEATAACARRVEDHVWAPTRGPSVFCRMEAAVWRADSEKWGCAGGWTCVDFVTIKQ